MKKYLLFVWLLLCSACVAQAQQDSSTIWIVTGGTGNIYTFNMNTCNMQFQFHTGGQFLDIAHTPNGNLYANSPDSLYQLYENGFMRVIGALPRGKGLVGLNDSILFMDSLEYLVSIKTADASTHLIGRTGYRIDGDLTWVGNDLYMIGCISLGGDTIGASYLVKLQFNEDFSQIQNIDTFILNINNAYSTPALATEYIDSLGYVIVALPGNNGKYIVDTSTGAFTLICNGIAPDSAYGASCMIFPKSLSTAIYGIQTKEYNISISPNPSTDIIHIKIKNNKVLFSRTIVKFYDQFGKLLMNEHLNSDDNRIDISDYPPGLYIIKLILNSQDIFVKKIIKK